MFVGPKGTVKLVHSDDSGEIAAACKELSWSQRVSTPGKQSSNGVIERANRTILEGARTLLTAANIDKKWWSRAVRYFCYVYNITRRGKDGQTPYHRRFNSEFTGELHPFGCLVSYRPSTTKANAGENKFGPNTVEGIFMGYYVHLVGRWSKDYLVVNLEAFKTSPIGRYVHVIRVDKVTRRKGPPVFPSPGISADDRAK